MKVLLGVISPVPAWTIPQVFVDSIRRTFPLHEFLEAWDDEAIRRLLPDVEVAFTPAVDSEAFASATRLRWIQSPAVGIGHLLYPTLVSSDVVLTNARGVRARAMAEHVLAVTLALARQLHTALRHQASRIWAQDLLERREAGAIRTLQGSHLGIVGLGSIGMEVARLAAPFGLRVSAIRRRTDVARPVEVEELLPPDRLDDLLGKSDIVVLAAPLTPATQALIGRRELNLMKRGAFLINVGRGALVDDGALVEALRAGHLGGAALDVFTEEPLDPSSPYWALPNVIVTPHTSGTMEDYWTPLVALFSENLRRFESGLALLNVVDKTAGY
jgi:phosphoglycerate dehydrogenase-like enzyme